jgi:integrase
MRTRLTKLVVEKAEVKSQRYTIWDAELRGFGVKVQPSGTKSYFAYYRTQSGQQRKPAIGSHGKVTTEEARQIAKKWIAASVSGVDISENRKEARAAPLIRDLAQKYLNDYAACFKKPSSFNTDKSNLNNHVLPLIGTKKVSDVTRADIEDIKIAIKDGRTAARRKAKFRGRSVTTGGPGVANRTISLLSKMLGCAVDWGMRSDNPALRIKKYPEHRKDRFLDTGEIHRLFRALEQSEIKGKESPHAIACLRLLLFTGLRLGEVRDVHWIDVDLARGILKLRDSKTGARTVPLNEQAILVLKKHRSTMVDQFVIQSATGNGRPSLGKPWQRIRKLANIDDSANIHCLRHTFASWAVMGGLSLAQTGALLGHKSTQTTLRYADHLTEAVRGYSQKAVDKIESG